MHIVFGIYIWIEAVQGNADGCLAHLLEGQQPTERRSNTIDVHKISL